MAKIFIGKSSGGVPMFFSQNFPDYVGEGISLLGTDYIIGPDAADWIAAQTAEGKALARLEAARQEGVIGSYRIWAPTRLNRWRVHVFKTDENKEPYQFNGDNMTAALTAAADYADSLRNPPLPDVGSMSHADRLAELISAGWQTTWGEDMQHAWFKFNVGFAEAPTWEEATRLALTAAREQQK